MGKSNGQNMTLDEQAGKIWLDGRLVDGVSAQAHILSHSLHYGSAAFEGIRVYNGKAFALEKHMERLLRSAQILGYSVPFSLTRLLQVAREVIKVNAFSDAYIRPIAWRGSSTAGVSPDASCPIHVAVAAWVWPQYFSSDKQEQGLRLSISQRFRRPSPEWAPTDSKASGLYIIGSMAYEEAASRGFDDALMLDYRGLIAEGSGANIFFVKDGDLITPIPDCFLDGITRNKVIGLAEKRKLKVVQRHVEERELASFDEAFFAGTAIEVTPISQIDDHKFAVGPLGLSLSRDYKSLVRA